jgi:hypothetical protein
MAAIWRWTKERARKTEYFIKGKDPVQKVVLEASRDDDDRITEPELLTIVRLSNRPSYLASIQKTVWKRCARLADAAVPCRKALEILEFLVRHGPENAISIVQHGSGVLQSVVNSHQQTFENHREYLAESQARNLASTLLAIANDARRLADLRAAGEAVRARAASFPLDPQLIQLLQAFAEKEVREGRQYDFPPGDAGFPPPADSAFRAPASPTWSPPSRPAPKSDSDDGELDFDPRAAARSPPRAHSQGIYSPATPVTPVTPTLSAGGWRAPASSAPPSAVGGWGAPQDRAFGGQPQSPSEADFFGAPPTPQRASSQAMTDDLLLGPAPPPLPQAPRDEMAGVILDLSVPLTPAAHGQQPPGSPSRGGMLDQFGDLAQLDLHDPRPRYGRPDQTRGSGQTLGVASPGFPR